MPLHPADAIGSKLTIQMSSSQGIQILNIATVIPQKIFKLSQQLAIHAQAKSGIIYQLQHLMNATQIISYPVAHPLQHLWYSHFQEDHLSGSHSMQL